MAEEDKELHELSVTVQTLRSNSVSKLESSAQSQTEHVALKTEESKLFSGQQLAVIFSAFALAFFLLSLDQTILATALPTIASHFDAISDLSWIASAYFLPQAAFMLFFGKVLAFTPPKIVFLLSIVVFEIGSLLSAVAPSVDVLIIGRAISGLGAVGLYVSVLSIVARITTLKQRPLMMSVFGGVYAASSLGGPVIGGEFSDHVTWRWCFYLNLPIGGLAFIAVFIILPNLPAMEKDASMRSSWMHLDWMGTFLSLAMVTFLLISLQWGGNERPWSDPLVIVFLVLGVLLIAVFAAWVHWYGEGALIPISMLVHKNIFCASVSALFAHICFTVFTYYSPLLYQLKGHSATRSGVDIFPFMVTGVLASVIAGGVTSANGMAWPFLVFGPVIATVGFGMYYTVEQATSFARMGGFQVLVGIGLGCVTQLPIVVAQAQYANKEHEHLVPQVTSLASFIQLVGSAIGLPISSAVFSSSLTSNLNATASTASLSPSVISQIRASLNAIFDLLPAGSAARTAALAAYVQAVRSVWLVCIPSAALAAVVAVFISRDRLKKLEGT